MPALPDPLAEWLETDGLGGYTSGTVSGVRTRRYHALLLPATTPPTGRFVLVNGFEAWVETKKGSYPITSQLYAPDVIHPNGRDRIESFTVDPWPTWTFKLEDGTRITQEIFVAKHSAETVLRWRLNEGNGPATLFVRPLISGRDYHSLHHENSAFRFASAVEPGRVAWHPYEGLPTIHATHNGKYDKKPDWFRNFLYLQEQARGLDCVEDLAAPGIFRWDLSIAPADLTLSVKDSIEGIDVLRQRELKRRKAFATPLHRAADQYIVKRGAGKTIIAGYPWFTDWGRDTFISLRGLGIAGGRLDDARRILLDWAGTISEGMVPNRFPDAGSQPEYNSVDASLWYIIAVHEFLTASAELPSAEKRTLTNAIQEILSGYAKGTRYGIRADTDGLLSAGEPGVQLTWMDAKVGDWVVTPRIGKPVEVQALWLNALSIGAWANPAWKAPLIAGVKSFRAKFWDADAECLYDVIDVDHVVGKLDASLRPNQIFAVGGLPLNLLEADKARQVVDAVERKLLTPLGLRTLSADDPHYIGHYRGGVRDRDSAYHQGTAWPWLMGAFAEAWERVRGDTAQAKSEAKKRFIDPMVSEMNAFGIGHLAEIADGDAPNAPNGCPFQAWSVGEAMRVGR